MHDTQRAVLEQAGTRWFKVSTVIALVREHHQPDATDFEVRAAVLALAGAGLVEFDEKWRVRVTRQGREIRQGA